MVKAVQANASFIPQPVASCCTDLMQRVQAVWDAFLALITNVWAHLTDNLSKPLLIDRASEIDQGKCAFMKEACAHPTVQAFLDATPRLPYPFPSYVELVSSGYSSLSGDSIPKRVEERELLQSLSNNNYPDAVLRAFLDLGADPNSNSTNMSHRIMPLHYAVISGSLIAYKTLREAGANPWVRSLAPYTHIPDKSPIELAYAILRSHLGLKAYFEIYPKGFFDYLNPTYFDSRPNPKEDLQNLDKIIAYEVNQVSREVDAALNGLLPMGISRIISSYYLSGEPAESGTLLVQAYQHHFVRADSTQGVHEYLRTHPLMTVKEQLDLIYSSAQVSQEIFYMIATTYDYLNCTETFLQLGGDPNQRITLGKLQNFTPLHAAVLLGNPFAYKTLRAWGADPTVRLGADQTGETCIEMAQRMFDAFPSTTWWGNIRAFAKDAGLQAADMRVFGHKYEFFFKDGPPKHYGRQSNLKEILDYETQK